MFTEVQVESFKCFESLSLRLRPLTLLSGVNGGGKSSVIQSLMLLAQTISMREWGRSLLLEGPELALGSVADVLNHQSARRHLLLGVATASERVEWCFKAEDRRALSMELDSLKVNGKEADLTAGVRWLLPRREAEPGRPTVYFPRNVFMRWSARPRGPMAMRSAFQSFREGLSL